jgi:hypothetical protein
MSHRVKMLGGVALLVFMATAGGACGKDPAGVTNDPSAASAAYDGGHTFGSGNQESGPTGGTDSGATTQSDSTPQRGGVLIGSGH